MRSLSFAGNGAIANRSDWYCLSKSPTNRFVNPELRKPPFLIISNCQWFSLQHEQRHRSFASFVVTSTTTNANEELENYICSMNESTSGGSATPPVHIEFQAFVSPRNQLTTYSSRSQNLSPHTNEQLIVYSAPIIQSQLSSSCRETGERLKELKKEKSTLIAAVNKTPSKQRLQPRNDPQQ